MVWAPTCLAGKARLIVNSAGFACTEPSRIPGPRAIDVTDRITTSHPDNSTSQRRKTVKMKPTQALRAGGAPDPKAGQ